MNLHPDYWNCFIALEHDQAHFRILCSYMRVFTVVLLTGDDDTLAHRILYYFYVLFYDVQ